MKILFFTKYSRNGASSRLRTMQYIPYFEKNGYKCTVKPLFDDEYLYKLYNGKRSYYHVFKYYIKRFFDLRKVFFNDVVVIEYELFPYFPAIFEWFFKIFKVKYIVDYDDAVFHNYDQSTNLLINKTLSNKIDLVMKYSSVVIAGNDYLAQRALSAGAKMIEQIPTVVDIDRYIQKSYNKATNSTITIGWIGSPSTVKYVIFLFPVFYKLAEKFNITIHIIGAYTTYKTQDFIHYIPWTEETEKQEIAKFDIGIMPLENTNWEKGKCSYKLIQYMASKLPVIASPVGMNNEVVTHNVNGYLASDFLEWENYLTKLILDDSLRINMGEEGYNNVKENYSLHKTSKKYINILKKVTHV
ncbi:glycosyltransferase involved in cell wall biosynthesis [Flavobacterium croceum DSM 17960]|uniref:Glycosyltransferase involved in cell wall biosynthesis n=1 Tax=Flavobacterium croceum DSM 17960 TaxID=1121886 RepID=A0A2S4N9H8_9FLAO|nr:glycosyltransferase family 4 protein [Flavobacterium croceum]POS02356.1 glycosyltransferase involved in cell wall biosynthesis [Flavobacterium croceum DSM 17960]